MNRLLKLALLASLMWTHSYAPALTGPRNPFLAITEVLESYASHLRDAGSHARAAEVTGYADKFREANTSREDSVFLGFDAAGVLTDYAKELRAAGLNARAEEIEALAEWWDCRNVEAFWQDHGEARNVSGDALRYLILQNLSEDCHALLLGDEWRFDRMLAWAAVHQARDGRVEVTAEDVLVSVVIPDGMESADDLAHLGNIFFTGAFVPYHTNVASIEINPLGLVRSGWYRDVYSEMGTQQRLKRLLEEVDRIEYSQTREGRYRLRSYEHVGGTLPIHAARGLVCRDRVVVQEDRGVPGRVGRMFILHIRLYACVQQDSQVPVEVEWSERYPADSRELSASFEADATAFFESLRIDSLRW